MDVIVTHNHTDFDGLGAMLAAKHLMPRAVIALGAELDANVRRFVAVYRDAFGMVPLASLDLTAIRRVIMVDCQDPHRCGQLGPLLDRTDVRWEVIDHHPRGDRLPPEALIELRPTGSATTIMVARLKAAECHLSEIEATAMLLGIMEDTGRLSVPGTTREDAEAVAYLLERGARLDQLAEYLELPLSAAQQDLLVTLLAGASPETLGGTRALLVGADLPHGVPELSVIAERLIALFRVQVVVLAVRGGPFTQVVARAQDSGLDLRRLLAPWHAGGHPQAVSAHSDAGVAPQALLAEVRSRLMAAEGHAVLARDLMSSPVRTVEFDDSVDTVLETMRRWGHTALPVIHHGRPQGLISRRDLDRAVHHGFGSHSIKGLVARRVERVTPETPLEELRDRMAALEIGRLLVMEGDRLIGIVTRSDLIRHLARPRRAGPAARLDLSQPIRELWPTDWREALDEVGRIAGERPTYLVGGAVRDLLLGRPSFDVDLLVEGDAMALARDLATRLGAQAKLHEAFGTAHVHLPSGKRVDLATARLEHYPHPGALPVVSPGTARQDLSRRDFTVNALAMRINPDHFGETLDGFGGLQDLEDQTLRILHPVSFIEDPIRIYRAARFETKLGFHMAPDTEAAARYAVASGRFDSFASERLKLELRLGFTLDRALPYVMRLADLDAWRLLHPAVQVSPAMRAALRRLDRLRRCMWQDEAIAHDWVLPLVLLTAPLGESEREAAIAPLQLSRAERQVLEGSWEAVGLAEEAIAAMRPGELAARLASLPPAAPWLLAAVLADATARRRVREAARALRTVKLERVDGAWLMAQGLAPGPVFKEVLAALLAEKRSGLLPTAAAEEERARAWLRERGLSV